MALAKIMAYLGLNKSEFDRGMGDVRRQTQSASKDTANIGRNFKGAVIAAAFRRIAAAVGDYLDTVRESEDYSLISEEDVSRLDRYNAQLERGKNTILATIAAKASDAAGWIERAAGTLGAMSGDSSMSMKEAWELSKKISDEMQAQFDAERNAAKAAMEKAEAEKAALAAAKERAELEKQQAEAHGEQMEFRGKFAEAALDPAKRREMEKTVKKNAKDQRKLDKLAEAAEYGMSNGIEFSKLGKSKQLAWIAKHGDPSGQNDTGKNIKGLFDTTQKIADALGVGMAE